MGVYDQDVPGDVELISLMVDISMMAGEVYPHLHVTLCDEKFKVTGGHLSADVVNATVEIFVKSFDWTMKKKHFQETGFRLLALDDEQ